MTLCTHVAVGGQVDPQEVYAFCRTLLGTPEHIAPEVADGRIANPPGIGLDAWLWVNHGPEGQPLPLHTHDQWCDDDTHEWAARDPRENGWAYVDVSFDTAYGYRGEGGESCSDLHVRLMTALGQWLDARGLPWQWQNEYTGEWFPGADQEALAAFGSAHRATGADAWFRNVVMPAITGKV